MQELNVNSYGSFGNDILVKGTEEVLAEKNGDELQMVTTQREVKYSQEVSYEEPTYEELCLVGRSSQITVDTNRCVGLEEKLHGGNIKNLAVDSFTVGDTIAITYTKGDRTISKEYTEEKNVLGTTTLREYAS